MRRSPAESPLSTKPKAFESLFLHELRDLHSAGARLVRVLPKMIRASHHADLKEPSRGLLDQTRAQQDRLDGIFAAIDKSAEGDACLGMTGLVEEIERLLERNADEAVRDASLIGAANAWRTTSSPPAGRREPTPSSSATRLSSYTWPRPSPSEGSG